MIKIQKTTSSRERDRELPVNDSIKSNRASRIDSVMRLVVRSHGKQTLDTHIPENRSNQPRSIAYIFHSDQRQFRFPQSSLVYNIDTIPQGGLTYHGGVLCHFFF